ncbi:MAG: hypothetical protein B6241_12675 [Spirochaetaceae bacterium 4572_59]|nr:MAG: hypothetical protein B6241_12675 [Spirochaetaceae bacterium 4572_59]
MFIPEDISQLKNYKAKRSCSYDRTGGNRDSDIIQPGETLNIFNVKTAGKIVHIWFTINSKDLNYLRKVTLRAYWDGEKNPSIECPVGDFFGSGHAIANSYENMAMNMIGGKGFRGDLTAFNFYLPMPFSDGAIMEVSNDSSVVMTLYYYVDYQEMETIPENTARFHAQWRRENPCKGRILEGYSKGDTLKFFDEAKNTSGEDNYTILEAKGVGHYVGCNLSVDNIDRDFNVWWGEGDDMIFVDDEAYPPALHGTGSEDYFCHAWGMHNHAGLHAGLSIAETEERHKLTAYRLHLADPVPFEKNIRVTIEHGHDNHQSNDYASTAYWYQMEPHMPFPSYPSVEERLPRPEKGEDFELEEKYVALMLKIDSYAAFYPNFWVEAEVITATLHKGGVKSAIIEAEKFAKKAEKYREML